MSTFSRQSIEEIREVLAALKGRLQRVPTPEDILKAATPVGSPLHVFFEWDDTEAAKKWRLRTASDMLRYTKVTVHTEKKDSRPAKVALVQDLPAPRSKIKAPEVVLDKPKALAEARAGLENWLRRFSSYPELGHVAADVRKGLGKFPTITAAANSNVSIRSSWETDKGGLKKAREK